MIHEEAYYTRERLKLVAELKALGFDDNILDAIAQVPRHLFLGEESTLGSVAYTNRQQSIGYGYFIDRPLYSALQVMVLRVKPDDVILEIGTGSGYLAALLCVLGAKVHTRERNPLLYYRAVKLFEKLNYPIKCFTTDQLGVREFAPFDKIITQCKEKPDITARRLKVGGFAIYTEEYRLRRIIRHDEWSFPEELALDMRVWEKDYD